MLAKKPLLLLLLTVLAQPSFSSDLVYRVHQGTFLIVQNPIKQQPTAVAKGIFVSPTLLQLINSPPKQNQTQETKGDIHE